MVLKYFSLNICRLNCLMIDHPNQKQLQNIEELQKELRILTKKKIEELSDENIMKFANMIFRVKNECLD